jgi:hypothetical protein
VPSRKIYREVEKVKKVKEGRKKGPEAPNFQERMAKMAQILSNLSKNFFDFAVKKFCRSSLAPWVGYGVRPQVLDIGALPSGRTTFNVSE